MKSADETAAPKEPPDVDVGRQGSRTRLPRGRTETIKGFRLEGCFGPKGCPNRALGGERLLAELTSLLNQSGLLEFLRTSVKGELKYHHEFRISISECPNACSQPQIKDIGIIGACLPRVTDIPCNRCGACVGACRENGITLSDGDEKPVLDASLCLACGACVAACPNGTLAEKSKGFRVLLGGKLGRHPRLAKELPGTYSEGEVLDIARGCIDLYTARSRNGMRLADVLREEDMEMLLKRFQKNDKE